MCHGLPSIGLRPSQCYSLGPWNTVNMQHQKWILSFECTWDKRNLLFFLMHLPIHFNSYCCLLLYYFPCLLWSIRTKVFLRTKIYAKNAHIELSLNTNLEKQVKRFSYWSLKQSWIINSTFADWSKEIARKKQFIHEI